MRDYDGIVALADMEFRKYGARPRVYVREAGDSFLHPGVVYTVDYMPDGRHRVELHHHETA